MSQDRRWFKRNVKFAHTLAKSVMAQFMYPYVPCCSKKRNFHVLNSKVGTIFLSIEGHWCEKFLGTRHPKISPLVWAYKQLLCTSSLLPYLREEVVATTSILHQETLQRKISWRSHAFPKTLIYNKKISRLNAKCIHLMKISDG